MILPYVKISFLNPMYNEGLIGPQMQKKVVEISDFDLIKRVTWTNSTKNLDTFSVTLYDSRGFYRNHPAIKWKGYCYLTIGYKDSTKPDIIISPKTVISGMIDEITVTNNDTINFTCVEIMHQLGYGFGIEMNDDGTGKKVRSRSYKWDGSPIEIWETNKEGKKEGELKQIGIRDTKEYTKGSATPKAGAGGSSAAKQEYYSMRTSAVVLEVVKRNMRLKDFHGNYLLHGYYIVKTDQLYMNDKAEYFKEKPAITQPNDQNDLTFLKKLAEEINFECFVQSVEESDEIKNYLFFMPPRLAAKPLMTLSYKQYNEETKLMPNLFNINYQTESRKLFPDYQYFVNSKSRETKLVEHIVDSLKGKKVVVAKNESDQIEMKTAFETISEAYDENLANGNIGE